jgi:hypothetical protein
MSISWYFAAVSTPYKLTITPCGTRWGAENCLHRHLDGSLFYTPTGYFVSDFLHPIAIYSLSCLDGDTTLEEAEIFPRVYHVNHPTPDPRAELFCDLLLRGGKSSNLPMNIDLPSSLCSPELAHLHSDFRLLPRYRQSLETALDLDHSSRVHQQQLLDLLEESSDSDYYPLKYLYDHHRIPSAPSHVNPLFPNSMTESASYLWHWYPESFCNNPGWFPTRSSPAPISHAMLPDPIFAHLSTPLSVADLNKYSGAYFSRFAAIQDFSRAYHYLVDAHLWYPGQSLPPMGSPLRI